MRLAPERQSTRFAVVLACAATMACLARGVIEVERRLAVTRNNRAKQEGRERYVSSNLVWLACVYTLGYPQSREVTIHRMSDSTESIWVEWCYRDGKGFHECRFIHRCTGVRCCDSD